MYEVVISRRAESDLNQAYRWWANNRSKPQADRWYNGFLKKLFTLAVDPDRFPHASENRILPCEVRQINFGIGRSPTHRAIFTIRPDSVVILRIRHLAQALLTADDIV